MKLKDTYDDCLQTMYGLRRFGIKLELSTIQGILNGLENPQNRMACIHVAGTNGKGSVASALASILRLASYSVGLYTSPHLVKFNERICINGRPISDENVVLSYEAVKSVRHGGREPTFFEFSTAMALYEFGRQKVEWAVIETGMGGRLDATNIIKPALAVITNISVEHKMYLGNTITQIAAEKGGIIKKYTPVVTGVKQKSVISVLKTIAGSQSAPFYRFGDAFRVRRNRNGTFNYYGIEHIWPNLQTGLMGRYQVDNAAIVLAACEVLNKTRTDLPLETIKDGLMQNRWPGRLEVVSRSPLVILDGAHNFNAARNLARFLSENLAGRNITLVVGILDDKPYKAMLKSLLPFCSRAILTAPKIDRALPPETLLAVAQQIVAETTIVPDVDSAVQHAVETASPDDVICIAGSLYVVGEAKEALGKKDSPINKKLQALGA